MRQLQSYTKSGFSLIEVVFAISFLIFVGIGMVALNTSALNLITTNEIVLAASNLNSESLSFLAAEEKNRLAISCADSSNASFAAFYRGTTNLAGYCTSPTTVVVNIDCSVANATAGCALSSVPKPVQLGNSKLTFTRAVSIKPIVSSDGATHYSLTAQTSWGGGARQKISASQLVE